MIDPPRHGEGNRDAKRRGGGASQQKMPPNIQRARKLRREMSYPEVLLWQRLRGAPMGVRFRRQHPIGDDYVADFYCAAARLVVEVDGEVHSPAAARQHDRTRDAFIQQRGMKIVRIPARHILADADLAADAIVSLAVTPLHHRASRDGPQRWVAHAPHGQGSSGGRSDPSLRAGEDQE